MAQVTSAAQGSAPAAPPADPRTRRWTREEFYQMAALGLFTGQRTELIEGAIMVLSPQKAQHFTTADRVMELLRDHFGPGFHVRMQGPLDLGPYSEPEPDVAVVPGPRARYATQHPRTAVLVVEVSDTTLAYDRTHKASLYAAAGIEDYWIINLVDGQVEVRRDPVPDPTPLHGHTYATLTVLRPPASVAPLATPGAALAAADLVP